MRTTDELSEIRWFTGWQGTVLKDPPGPTLKFTALHTLPFFKTNRSLKYLKFEKQINLMYKDYNKIVINLILNF